jgi:hypothetical protein
MTTGVRTARSAEAGTRRLQERVAELEEEAVLLRRENATLRRLLNDPDRLIQRGLRLLAAIAPILPPLP